MASTPPPRGRAVDGTGAPHRNGGAGSPQPSLAAQQAAAGAASTSSTTSLARKPSAAIQGIKEMMGSGQKVRAEGLHLSILPRSEFVPKDSESACMHCSKRFFALRKRHHCRCCGHVLCSKCSQYRVRLRLCSGCYQTAQELVGEANSDDEGAVEDDHADPSVLDEVDALQEAVTALQEELRRQIGDAAGLQEQLEASNATTEALKGTLAASCSREEAATLKTQLSEAVGRAARETAARRRAEEELQEAKDMVSRLRQRVSSKAADVDAMDQNVTRLQEQLAAAQASNRAAAAAAAATAAAASPPAADPDAAKKLRAAQRRAAAAEKALTAAQAEVRRLAEANAKLNSSAKHHKAQVEGQRSKVQTEQRARERLTTELEAVKSDKAGQERRAKALETRSSRLEQSLQAREQNLQQLGEALSEAHRENADLQAKVLEHERAPKPATPPPTPPPQRDEAAEAAREVLRLQREVDDSVALVSEANALRDRLSATLEATAAAQAAAEAGLASEQARATTLEGELQAARQQAERVEAKAHKAQSELRAVSKQSTSLAAQVEALEADVAARDREHLEAERRLKKTRAEADLLKMKLSRSQHSSKKQAAGQLTEMEARAEAAERQVEELREQQAAAPPRDAETEQRLAELRSRLRDARAAAAASSKAHQARERELQAQIGALTTERDALQAEVDRLKAEIKSLKQRLRDTQEKAARDRQRWEAEHSALLQEEGSQAKTEKRLVRLQERNSAREAEVVGLRTQLKSVKEQLEATERRLSQRERELSSQEKARRAEAAQLRRQLAKATADRADLLATVNAGSHEDSAPRVQASRREDIDNHLEEALKASDPDGLFQLTKIQPGLYRTADGKKLAIRMAGGVIMVRVGGGWQDLKEYLTSHLAKFFSHSRSDAKVRHAVTRAERYGWAQSTEDGGAAAAPETGEPTPAEAADPADPEPAGEAEEEIAEVEEEEVAEDGEEEEVVMGESDVDEEVEEEQAAEEVVTGESDVEAEEAEAKEEAATGESDAEGSDGADDAPQGPEEPGSPLSEPELEAEGESVRLAASPEPRADDVMLLGASGVYAALSPVPEEGSNRASLYEADEESDEDGDGDDSVVGDAGAAGEDNGGGQHHTYLDDPDLGLGADDEQLDSGGGGDSGDSGEEETPDDGANDGETAEDSIGDVEEDATGVPLGADDGPGDAVVEVVEEYRCAEEAFEPTELSEGEETDEFDPEDDFVPDELSEGDYSSSYASSETSGDLEFV